VESAAYFSIAELARATAGRLVLDARVEGRTLRLEVLADEAPATPAEVEDRVAALGGDLVVAPAAGGGAVLRIGLPCGS
jgi:hypothetical protein